MIFLKTERKYYRSRSLLQVSYLFWLSLKRSKSFSFTAMRSSKAKQLVSWRTVASALYNNQQRPCHWFQSSQLRNKTQLRTCQSCGACGLGPSVGWSRISCCTSCWRNAASRRRCPVDGVAWRRRGSTWRARGGYAVVKSQLIAWKWSFEQKQVGWWRCRHHQEHPWASKEFFQGWGVVVDFFRGGQKDFLQGGNSSEISFYQLQN